MSQFKRNFSDFRFSENKRYQTILFVIVIILSFISFITLYGVIPLNPMDDRWLTTGYMESDIIVHYAGWCSFRNSAWHFPLGLADTTGFPNGTIIGFTDSIPLVSIIFKLFSFLLPETFQFFGWYVLACFILQGIGSAKLLGLWIKDRLAILLGCPIFLFSPIMVERAFKHSGLTAHFIVVFSLYLYFQSKKGEHKLSYWYWLLGVLSIGIHPYFLPMVMAIYFANTIDYLYSNKKVLFPILHMGIGTVIMYVFGYCIGTLGYGKGTSSGYGEVSLNLNGFFNPRSLGEVHWSNIIPKLTYSDTWGAHDGFAYLGLGILLSLLVAFVIYLINKCKIIRFKRNDIQQKEGIKRYQYTEMVVVLFLMTIFAISNRIWFGDKLLFQYNLPSNQFVYDICYTFRASGRMVWPLIYIIFVVCIVWLFERKRGIILLALMVVIQIVDLSPAISFYHSYMSDASIEQRYEKSIFVDENWEYLMENIDNLWDIGSMTSRTVILDTQKHHVKNNIRLMNRYILLPGTYDFTDALYHGREIDNNTAYMFHVKDMDEVAWLSWNMNRNINIYKLNAFNSASMDAFYILWNGEIPGMDKEKFEISEYQIAVMESDNEEANVQGSQKFVFKNSRCNYFLLKEGAVLLGEDGTQYEIEDIALTDDEKGFIITFDKPTEGMNTYFMKVR